MIGLSRRELIHTLIVFLAGGFETASTAMAWFIHYISKHSRVQQKIKAELMKIDDDKKPLSLNDLDSLVYLDAVIKEVLRLSPPIDATYRTLTADDRLPASDAQLYKGDQVCVSFYSLARDPQYWSIDSELFYPERFLDEDKSHNHYALLPFGAGHRQCAGQDFARFELKVMIARLMQHATFDDGGSQINSGGYIVGFSTMPKHVGVTIKGG